MSAKKVTIGAKPKRDPVAVDAWVGGGDRENASNPSPAQSEVVTHPATRAPAAAEPMKRLTIDISEGLHRRVKTGCAAEGAKIADVVREYLDKRFP